MKEFNAGYVKGYNECLAEIKEILDNIDPGDDYNDHWYNMITVINKVLEMPEKINVTIKFE